MFDKNLFDRNAYDRSVSSDGISATFLSNGYMSTRLVIAYPLPLPSFTGRGDMNASKMLMLINTNINFDGYGQIRPTEFVLRLPLAIGLSGSGDLQPGLAVKTPIKATLTGESYMESLSDFVYQHVICTLSGKGDIERDQTGYWIMRTFMEDFTFDGRGHLLDEGLVLHLPLEILMSGSSGFILRRLGALNENALELNGINLKPGEEVTIDTDLLSVFFGYTEDVSSVTTDSVFFELSPGENDIVIDTNTGESMLVTAIWQNRWL